MLRLNYNWRNNEKLTQKRILEILPGQKHQLEEHKTISEMLKIKTRKIHASAHDNAKLEKEAECKPKTGQ